MSRLFYVEECTSTMDEILSFIDTEFSDITSVYTFNQTKGRGQYGNLWENTQNQNIAFSLAVKEADVKTSLSLFNYYTAVLVRNFIATLTSSHTEIKWPNDIIIKNKKVSGLLTERKKKDSVGFYIIGIGINVNQTDFSGLLKAGSLFTQTGTSFEPDDVARKLHNFLTENLRKEVISTEIMDGFNSHLYRKNQISVFEKNGLRQNGIIKNADEDGYIWIDLENEGLKKFFHKEIELLY